MNDLPQVVIDTARWRKGEITRYVGSLKLVVAWDAAYVRWTLYNMTSYQYGGIASAPIHSGSADTVDAAMAHADKALDAYQTLMNVGK